MDTQKQETANIEPEEERNDAGDPGKDEQKGIGQADTSEVQQGHQSDQSGKQPRPDRTKEDLSDQKRKQKPGHSDEKRTLGECDIPRILIPWFPRSFRGWLEQVNYLLYILGSFLFHGLNYVHAPNSKALNPVRREWNAHDRRNGG